MLDLKQHQESMKKENLNGKIKVNLTIIKTKNSSIQCSGRLSIILKHQLKLRAYKLKIQKILTLNFQNH